MKQLPHRTSALIILFAVLNAIDVVLTAGILESGGLEVAPISMLILSFFGYNTLLFFKLYAGTFAMWLLCEKDWKSFNGFRVAVICSIVMAVVVLWNTFGFVGELYY